MQLTDELLHSMIVPCQASPRGLTLRPPHSQAEYPRLVEIWRSAVRASHVFLAECDFQRIEENLASAYFPAVTLIVAERGGALVGFAGVSGANLEMLFVSDEVRGEGIGSALLAEALASHEVRNVDVNEQNPVAHGFYLSHGFTQVRRSEIDGDGRPYPILHLEISADRGAKLRAARPEPTRSRAR